MEPFENTAKMRAHKALMSHNKEAAKAFKDMNATYDAHLALYSSSHGMASGVYRTLNLNENKILKWKGFDLSLFNPTWTQPTH